MTTTPTTIRARMRHTKLRLLHLSAVTAALNALQIRRRKALAAALAHQLPKEALPTVMFDSVTVSAIPSSAKVVAGYTSGRFPTFVTLAKLFPNAKRLSIAVASFLDAECLDVEPGDAPPEFAARWVKRQLARGVKRPVVYTSVSGAQHLLDLLAQAGIKREQVRLWTAHYNFRPHVCGPRCGFGLKTNADATQWTDKALGRNLDQSQLAAGFWA